MLNNVKTALVAVAAGSLGTDILKILEENGCPVKAIFAAPGPLKKLSTGQMLSHAELATLVAAGVDTVKLCGMKAAPSAVPPTAPVAPARLVPTGETTANGNRVLQAVPVREGDPFGFLLTMAAGEADEERKKALRSTYNSMVSRTESAAQRYYRDALVALGIKIEPEQHTDSTAAARSRIGTSKMVLGVLARKGLSPNRETGTGSLLAEYRKALSEKGIVVTDEQNLLAIEESKSGAASFAASAVEQIKAALA